MLVDQLCKDHVCNFRVPAHTSIDATAVKIAYEDVRSDRTDTKWAVFKYDRNTITAASKGTEFDRFRKEFHDAERCYGYARFQIGDQMCKRTMFVLITWIGKDVGVMDRAKMAGDKPLVTEIITNYTSEFRLENSSELDEQRFIEELTKVGGAVQEIEVRSA